MSFDHRFFPRAPSFFHNAARQRLNKHPRHDAMQQELLTFLRGRVVAGMPDGTVVDREIEGEFPLVLRGRAVSFVDAVEFLSVNFFKTLTAFEVKPEIDTVYGILQQVKAQLELLKSNVPADFYRYNLVVPASDPQLADMRIEWPNTWAWGITFDEDQDEMS